MSVIFSLEGIDHKFNVFWYQHVISEKKQAEPKGSVPRAGGHFIIWNRAFRRGNVL
jgi:hypothetical protein